LKFIDEVKIVVSSGKGGPGAVSFRREALVPRGGPDGGDGGRGGDVVFVADPQLGSLLDLKFKKTYQAQNGEPGEAQNRSGRNGEDLIMRVPPGTIIKSVEGEVLADLVADNERHVLLKGGIGGKGNTFYKTSVNQAPSVAQKGMPGQSLEVLLELKLLADVGIIGLPNAGKSTLISRISAARPKIADYPFTTLVPNLGVVRYGEFQTFVVADIPGLVAGAHKGVGLGSQFLRHIERTRLFVHLIDCSSMAALEPLQAYKDINLELKLHDEAKSETEGYIPLSSREQLVVLNKTDAADPEFVDRVVKDFEKAGVPVTVISAATGKNVKELVFEIGRKVFKEKSHS
jgi:GTP-binding protein